MTESIIQTEPFFRDFCMFDIIVLQIDSNTNIIKMIYLKTRQIFKSCSFYLKPERFCKSKFKLTKIKSE